MATEGMPRAILTVLLLMGPLWTGCAPAPTESGEPRSTTVSLTMGSLASSSHQGGVASPVEEAVLTVTSEGGTTTRRAPLGSRNRVAEFQVTVPTGPVGFHAEVVSNTGVLLYDGNADLMVESDGFQVQIDPVARAPVLLAVPDSIRAAPGGAAPGPGIFLLSNAGTDRVQWHVEEVSPPLDSCPTHPCLDIFPQSGTVSGLPDATPFIRVEPLNTPAQLYTIRLHTDQGKVEIQVDAAAAGAVEARVLGSAGGPPVLVRLRACASGTAGTPGTCNVDPSVQAAFASTNSEGVARFKGLRSGLWEVQPNATGWQSMTPTRRTVSLSPGGFVSTLFQATPIQAPPQP